MFYLNNSSIFIIHVKKWECFFIIYHLHLDKLFFFFHKEYGNEKFLLDIEKKNFGHLHFAEKRTKKGIK